MENEKNVRKNICKEEFLLIVFSCRMQLALDDRDKNVLKGVDIEHKNERKSRKIK